MNTLLFGFVIVGLASQALTAPQTVNSASVQQVEQIFYAMKIEIQSFVRTFENATIDKIPDALTEAIKIIYTFKDTMFTQETINEATLAGSDIIAYLESGKFVKFMLRFFRDIADSAESYKNIAPSAVEIIKLINNFGVKMRERNDLFN
ncbi:uncharacterized protein LOC123266988 [Cotesia glomerata]|uniref:Uncharacterized protein n=1 Tax=Cotesia glomerata TaxID=32391 RepID=A0AAV7HVP3_COTGL|nr:uncharacterized protein LOC123266988 [Cotesia glomerata]KAH0535796.1 hypothetical protein KQX54_019279 [Cotesia glomerata]